VSEERINKVSETYRGIRNALRYQLSNLYDFNPAKHSVADDQLTGLDRWILGEFSKLEKEVIEAYDKFEFHVVYQKVSQFIAVELSSIYHDVIKDRLYTDAANSHRRRSTQTALYRLVTGLCQMLAPILAFTADEAWEFVPQTNVNSVHESIWQLHPFEMTQMEKKIWDFVLLERETEILPELEKLRKNKIIGKSLDASISLKVNGRFEREFGGLAEELRELVNVSQLKIEHLDEPIPANEDGTMDRIIAKADGQKCERCWHWETDIGQNTEHPTICGRCIEAVKQFQA
jgi:isoleucyl-tRNA synthetase